MPVLRASALPATMQPLAAAIVEPVRVGPDLSGGDADKGADANEDGKFQDVPLLFQQRTARTEQSPGAYHGAEIASVFGMNAS